MKLRNLLFAILAVLAVQSHAQSISTSKLTKDNAAECYAEFKQIFTDGSCSELISPYNAMTDEQLINWFQVFPKELVDIAIKVKNNDWGKREKEFRIAEYEPHSNVSRWATALNTYQYSYLNNPTGITATTGDTLLIFIDNIEAGTFLKLVEIKKNDPWSEWSVYDAEKILTRGMNFITVTQPDATLFITYAVTTDTTSASKRLADYPKAKIHIEGGNVNGYFDKSRHTDADWRDMLANHFKHYSVQVKGERVLFHMERANIASVCPNTITDAIGWWDQCVQWQHELMGADKYHDRWNSLLMARDGYENMYMYANMNYTYYEYYTLKDILPWSVVYANPGLMWGPAHEIGHINQGAINLVSCTEASNNLFSNAHLFRTGKTTTRGVGVANCANDFKNGVSFPERGDVIGKSRMFYQLYLYFHAAKKDETFYPRLFEALRQDPIEKGTRIDNIYHTYAVKDYLKFAEKCCEVAQMDLSEFFEAWGFFKPLTDVVIGDYGTYNVNLTKEDAEASRARMQKYEKKGGSLMFIEDRIKPSKRTDGVEGNRLDFDAEFAIGKMGSTGQWEDYIDESVKAEGYFYSIKSGKASIHVEDNAKGALGFKLYDADTEELLGFSNTYTIEIPASAANKNFKVVAAQADGTDAVLSNVTESEDEEMQKLALEADISVLTMIVANITSDGNRIGAYLSSYAGELKELYTKAKTALNNNDTSEHTFGEWRRLIAAARSELENTPGAMAVLEEFDVYEMWNVKERGYYLCNDAMGLKGTDDYGREETCWIIESAGEEGVFYIKNKNGKYINDITLNLGAMCSGSTNGNAVRFRAQYLGNGTTYLIKEEDGTYLAMNSELKAVGNESPSDRALWRIQRIENNTSVIEIEEENGCNEIFDLQGRKVDTPLRGIYIRDGKKIYLK